MWKNRIKENGIRTGATKNGEQEGGGIGFCEVRVCGWRVLCSFLHHGWIWVDGWYRCVYVKFSRSLSPPFQMGKQRNGLYGWYISHRGRDSQSCRILHIFFELNVMGRKKRVGREWVILTLFTIWNELLCCSWKDKKTIMHRGRWGEIASSKE